MNCEQFREIAQDVARDELRGAEQIEDALAHADSCADCDGLLDAAESVSLALRAIAKRHAADAAPEHVEKALLHAFAGERRERKQARGGANSSSPWLWSAGAIGVAAMALLTVSLARHARPAAPAQRAGLAGRLAGPAARHTGELVASLDSHSANASPASASENGWVSPFANASAAADAEAQPFVPLSDAFDPATVDDDTVVRVVVPRETLEGFGLPLGEDVSGQVLADIIVTDDGTPQAIRVLGW